MSLLTILRSGVKTIDKIVKPLEPFVTYERFTPDPTTYGSNFLPAIQLRAIVDWKQAQVRTQSGVLTVSRAMVMFLDIKALVAATAGQGISENDRITLPDGTTGPILDMAGFIDAGTGHPIETEVFLG